MSAIDTQVIIAKLCGPAPYPALTQTDLMGKAAAVGWLSWLVRVHNIATLARAAPAGSLRALRSF